MDCTVGGAGHAAALLERIQPGGRLLGLDRDPAALERARERLGEGTVELRRADFRDLAAQAAAASISAADGILFDLGFSSHQVDDPERGFSFRQEGPLDMRLDPDSPTTAADLLNSLSGAELARVIRDYGEERWSARIAEFVVRRRPLSSTGDLARAVEAAIPRAAWPRDIHPATRTFQALRIAVNDELGSLEAVLPAAAGLLRPGGRMAVICFHSLEDRAVKAFYNRESRDCVCPPEQPVCTCGHRASLRVLTRRPLRPSAEEGDRNPRARSARLRAAEKL